MFRRGAWLYSCVIRIRLWPNRRDDHSGVLIGAGGTRRSGWPARVFSNDEARGSIDSPRTTSDRLHAARDKWQLAATAHTLCTKITIGDDFWTDTERNQLHTEQLTTRNSCFVISGNVAWLGTCAFCTKIAMGDHFGSG